MQVFDRHLILVLVVLDVGGCLLLLGDVKSLRRILLKINSLNPVLMLVGAVDSSHRDTLQLLCNLIRSLLLLLIQLADRLKKGVFPNHFVSDVELDHRASV